MDSDSSMGRKRSCELDNKELDAAAKKLKRQEANRIAAAKYRERKTTKARSLKAEAEALSAALRKTKSLVESLTKEVSTLDIQVNGLRHEVAGRELELACFHDRNSVLIGELKSFQTALGLPHELPEVSLFDNPVRLERRPSTSDVVMSPPISRRPSTSENLFPTRTSFTSQPEESLGLDRRLSSSELVIGAGLSRRPSTSENCLPPRTPVSRRPSTSDVMLQHSTVNSCAASRRPSFSEVLHSAQPALETQLPARRHSTSELLFASQLLASTSHSQSVIGLPTIPDISALPPQAMLPMLGTPFSCWSSAMMLCSQSTELDVRPEQFRSCPPAECPPLPCGSGLVTNATLALDCMTRECSSSSSASAEDDIDDDLLDMFGCSLSSMDHPIVQQPTAVPSVNRLGRVSYASSSGESGRFTSTMQSFRMSSPGIETSCSIQIPALESSVISQALLRTAADRAASVSGDFGRAFPKPEHSFSLPARSLSHPEHSFGFNW